jgi:hypothetical protein
MHWPHTHHAAGILQPQALSYDQGIIIPIPHENIGFIQLLGHLAGGFAFQGEGAGGDALLQPFGIRDALNRHTGGFRQNVQQSPA